MRKLENYKGEQARAFKKYAQKAKGNRADFEADLNFNEAPNKFTLKSIKDQIDYFGYEIEPFNMRKERDVGKFDDGGYFVFDRAKDKSVNDAWLDQLDQSNMFQELQEKAQAENSKKIQKQLKEANKNYERRMQKLRGDGFFSSTKFASKAEAQEFYQDKQQQENKEEEEVEENKQTEEKQKQQEEPKENQDVKLEKSFMNQMTQENNNDAQDETKQTLDILIDICTIIIKKSNEPSIYNIKKEELIPQKVSHLEDDDIF